MNDRVTIDFNQNLATSIRVWRALNCTVSGHEKLSLLVACMHRWILTCSLINLFTSAMLVRLQTQPKIFLSEQLH
jgi:hypothetical protein